MLYVMRWNGSEELLVMTDKEFIDLWNQVTREELNDCDRVQEELAACCCFCLELGNAGLRISWKEFPENYRRRMMTALLLRLAGTTPKEIFGKIKNIGRVETDARSETGGIKHERRTASQDYTDGPALHTL